MAAATPTPTPNPTGVGCHRWRYALRWEQPSRLAILKNVLGGAVTTYTGYQARGEREPERLAGSDHLQRDLGRLAVHGPVPAHGGRTYNHDCGGALGPACLLPTVTDVEGEQPGIYYSKGTWIWPDPGPYSTLSLRYDPNYSPLYLPNVDTTGAMFYRDQYKDPPISSPVPTVVVPGGYGTAGTYDGWAWTLNYGYAAPPGNDVIYGPDPGPPLGLNGFTPALMNETTLGSGDSIPGVTGTPISFQPGWTTREGSPSGRRPRPRR